MSQHKTKITQIEAHVTDISALHGSSREQLLGGTFPFRKIEEHEFLFLEQALQCQVLQNCTRRGLPQFRVESLICVAQYSGFNRAIKIGNRAVLEEEEICANRVLRRQADH